MIKKTKSITRAMLPVLAFVALALPSATRAEPKIWILGWRPSHWTNMDFAPYLEPAKPTQNTQFAADPWKPEDWIAQRGKDSVLLNGFYRADIIRDQEISWRNVPVLEVGPGFYMLGGQDKRRVVETLDYVYNVTGGRPNGMFILRDWRTDRAIGTYTSAGLQLQ